MLQHLKILKSYLQSAPECKNELKWRTRFALGLKPVLLFFL